ncbi:Putative Chitin deacetylase [Rhizopus microsporus]|nr:Putative Chitin deacetylase [Rhizopus microsporus]
MVSHLAAIITAIATAATIEVSAQTDYWQSFKTQVNPANISIPSIAQTTSLEPSVECTYYNPDPAYISINASEFPTVWQVATTNGMASSSEFLDLYNLIDWNSAPNIQPRKKNPDGSLDFTGYPSSDPDCWWSSSLCTTPKHPGINEDIVACNEPETWGLTYDDGPNCSHNVFYDYLREHDYKATMFYIGSNVIDWPYGAMRGMQDGHHIGAHTWSHEYTTTLTNQEVLAEFYYTQKAIKLATGVTPRYWRPPYGDVDDRVRWIASQLGLTAVIWNLDTDDWAAGDTATMQQIQNNYDAFIEMGTNGTFKDTGNIVLAHEISNDSMTLAVNNLARISSAYKNIMNVATCMNISNPYFEDFIYQPLANGNLGNQTNTPMPSGKTNSSTINRPSPKQAAVQKSSANAIEPHVFPFMVALMFILAGFLLDC